MGAELAIRSRASEAGGLYALVPLVVTVTRLPPNFNGSWSKSKWARSPM